MNKFKDTEAYICFKPFSKSWVAVHPNPKGIIQFVGSFFIFGYLPTIFYNSLFRSLYNKRYTIIAYPSSVFPPLIWELKLVDHWKGAIQILKEEYSLKYELIEYILKYGNQDSIDVYLNHSNYFWLGHSLGCKYISLLEILSDDFQNINNNLMQCNLTKEKLEIIKKDISVLESQRENNDKNIRLLLKKQKISKNISTKKYIIDQPSIFLAPEIYGTVEKKNGQPKSAIPFFEVFPSGTETVCLIDKNQNFFNLTALIAFSNDKISKDDVKELETTLSSRTNNFICKIFNGCDLKIDRLSSIFSHLKPLSNNSKPLANCLDKIFDELKQRIIPNYSPQNVQCEASKDC